LAPAIVNAGLVVAWLALAWRAGRQYHELTVSGRHPETSRRWFFSAKPAADLPVVS